MLRQRKGDQPKQAQGNSSPTAGAKTGKPKSSSALGSVLSFLIALIVITLATSYLVTDTLTFGRKVPNWRKYIPRAEKTFTVSELAEYDGTDPSKPIYLSLRGKVYDVTAGKDYYGPKGGYSFFAGRDATRSFITGCFKTHLTHDLRGLSDAELKGLDQWTSMYADSEKYFYVGKVLLPEIDPESPIPEPC
ncbi:MAG: hypothetical protein SGCHY_001099 [Lobulomycetales sp.]